MLRRVEDDIADDRREMTPHLEVNSLALVRDILPARGHVDQHDLFAA